MTSLRLVRLCAPISAIFATNRKWLTIELVAERLRLDYVPELEAVAPDELKTLFENPPRAGSFKPDQVLNNKFRFLGVIQANEPFYVFARLDPYEQAELMQKERSSSRPVTGEGDISTPNGQPVGQTAGRPKRTIPH